MKRQKAVLHLRVLGQDLKASFDLPMGPVPARCVLPAAYAIVDAVAQVASVSSEAEGRPVSCSRGCAACCRQLVSVSPIEAVALAALVDALPPDRQSTIRSRFARAIEIVRTAGLIDPTSPDDAPILCGRPANTATGAFNAILDEYFALGIACPFLENEECGIYADRPSQCREYLITSPRENCSHVGIMPTQGVTLPIYMSDKLVQFGVAPDTRPHKIPLLFALEWAAAHGSELQEECDSKQLLTQLVTLLDADSLIPFKERIKSENSG